MTVLAEKPTSRNTFSPTQLPTFELADRWNVVEGSFEDLAQIVGLETAKKAWQAEAASTRPYSEVSWKACPDLTPWKLVQSLETSLMFLGVQGSQPDQYYRMNKDQGIKPTPFRNIIMGAMYDPLMDYDLSLYVPHLYRDKQGQPQPFSLFASRLATGRTITGIRFFDMAGRQLLEEVFGHTEDKSKPKLLESALGFTATSELTNAHKRLTDMVMRHIAPPESSASTLVDPPQN